jgi:iron(III) transport system ATP-binding protein
MPETTSVDEQHERSDVILSVDGLSKRFGEETVLEAISFDVRVGEILTLLGPSGCGKTTTLRLIAGLERADSGTITIGGQEVTGERSLPPQERGVGVVFQEFALFPHLTAAENIAFGLEDVDPAGRTSIVQEMLDLVGLSRYAEHYPDELSGGQQQRVALARSLAPEPAVLLLDEPFSNLDVDLRVQMREEVRQILKAAGVTAISVTHDQEEALSISDRVAVMHAGQIEQIDTPEQIFQHPRSRFVAGFLGYASFVPGYVEGDEVRTPVGHLPREQIYGLAPEYDQTPIDVLVRPDDVSIASPDTAMPACGRVVARRYLGPSFLYEVELSTGEALQCMHNHDEEIPRSGSVAVSIDADHRLAWFPRDQRPSDEPE